MRSLRKASSVARASRWAIFGAVGAASLGAAGAASAQELTHKFLNPSFGGNPFYSDHLLSTALIDRPEEPEDEAAPPPTQEELIAQQIRTRLLSQLSGDILDAIEDAEVGDTGTFNLGEQRISFARTATETRVTFLNLTTGETTEIVVPSQLQASAQMLNGGGSLSAEQTLLGKAPL